ncbi:MAG TPA: hypothetical protein VFW13_15570 [Phenylobacterium sp.]|nr:hypothetical protein [Phenylobacterium sp.]
MTTNPFLAEMIGDDLANAVTDAQTRLSDATITARCTAGLWSVERGGAAVVSNLTYAAAITAVAALA